MAKVEDIVELSNVSRSTVFRFFNGQNIRPDAKKSIISAMKLLNYKTEELYRYLNMEIEISITSNFESFQGFAQVVEGITSKADEKGIKVNIARRSKEQMDDDYSNWNKSSTLKGVIVVGKSTEDTIYEAETIQKYNIPHIFINRIFPEVEHNYVSVDLQKGAFDIVTYLINKGHKNIAVIGCPHSSQVDTQKLNGYKLALHNQGIALNKNYYNEITSMDRWEETVKKILLSKERPTAFFAICDSHAIRFIKLANDLGLSIPNDIALVGMDDIDITRFTQPTISTVHVPFYKMGALAVDNLLRIMVDEEIESVKTIVKHSIEERESCGQSLL